ncbi:DNA-protecting protein DprA [Maritimibacter sp. 55A14]|uniref:DNA-processing protein DprA n=1 Tax=Maritimibacter sp. 55A14 TaxID=2174844 RepID=UPI000D618118|nr:DNA-processing protein DprA [Maritimibacter sp. 55A14]PWE33332.1 DNA-protecting protein DprA [Maritimibacter sp. 55A14]
MPKPIPPGTAEGRIAWLRLIRSRRVGPQTFQRLMAEHGDAEAALDALPAVAADAGMDRYTPCPADAARREFEAGMRCGARLLCLGEPDYPAALADIADAPPVLWALGHVGLARRPMVALVGARNASSLGTRMARSLAAGLAEAGFVTVSGLARGIDTAAHLASLKTGTVAVMAGGVDQIYPVENTGLAADIARDGLRLSERPVGYHPQARDFPRRNRIVSGLAQGIVVVEGAARSGSLITARTALDQGREVMAVPGHPMDARGAGCNMLIRDGATLVRNAGDVAEALARIAPEALAPAVPEPARQAPAAARQVAPQSPARPGPGGGADMGRRILALLSATPIPEDQLIRDLALPARDVARELVTLELDGKVARRAGGMLALAV